MVYWSNRQSPLNETKYRVTYVSVEMLERMEHIEPMHVNNWSIDAQLVPKREITRRLLKCVTAWCKGCLSSRTKLC